MKNTLQYQCLLFLALLAGAFACNKPPEYPLEPRIEFKAIESYPIVYREGGKADSLVLVIRFEDGDGDLGLSEADLAIPPYNEGNNNLNYLAEIFLKRKEAASFEKLDPPGSNGIYSGHFFRLAPDNRIGPLEGDLRYSVEIPSPNVFNIKTGDQIKFRVQIRDRKLNASNIVESEPHTIRYP